MSDDSDELRLTRFYTIMTDADQQTLASKLRSTISEDRLGTYLIATGFDEDRALRLYLWNAQIGEAFHLPLQAVEVALRNRINFGLCARYGAEWWKSSDFMGVLDQDRAQDLEVVQRRIRNRELPLGNGQVVAGLSFGYWVGMLQPSYNPPIWGGQLRPSFPHLPENRSRKSLFEKSRRAVFLRNRIWHHEPIFKLDHGKEFSALMELLGWLCPAKQEWIRPYCKIGSVVRGKP